MSSADIWLIVVDFFDFSDYDGLSLVIGLPCPGIVPVPHTVSLNATESVLEACMGRFVYRYCFAIVVGFWFSFGIFRI